LIEERQRLADTMVEIKTKMEKKVNETLKSKKDDKLVIIKIYSLEKDHCDVFNNIPEIKDDPDIICSVLTSDDLYYAGSDLSTGNITSSNITIDEQSLISFKERYGMIRPYDSNSSWWGTSRADNLKYYTQSDWGFGTSYAIWHNRKADLSKISIFFPMSDQLSTSSVSNDCFKRSGYSNYTVCSLCDDNCPFDRSMNSILSAINASRDYSSIINPIYSFNCDYENIYNSTAADTWNACYGVNSYCRGFAGGQPTTTWCADGACGGCSEQSGGTICFHESCTTTMYQQMQQMADATNGSIINLANISNINIDIERVIQQNLERYQFEVGYYNPQLPRDVVERTFFMPNNVPIDIRLWVYKNQENMTTYNCSFLKNN